MLGIPCFQPAALKPAQPIRFSALPSVDMESLESNLRNLRASQNPNTRLALLDLIYLSINLQGAPAEMDAQHKKMLSALHSATTPIQPEDMVAICRVMTDLSALYHNSANKYLRLSAFEEVMTPLLRQVFETESNVGVKDKLKVYEQSYMGMILPPWDFRYPL